LKYGGELIGKRKEVNELKGEKDERKSIIRRKKWKKLEGEMFEEKKSSRELSELKVLERKEKVSRRSENIVVGGGEFKGK
jgi:hypothetical protein